MKFPINNRFTNKTITVVKLDARYEKEPSSVKLGEAVRVAVAQKADMTGANLRGARLHDADLRSADLRGADLTDANLYAADLRSADLCGASLYGANLRGANLTGAELYSAELTGANLAHANLTGAKLTSAKLTDADLTEAGLTGANLYGADLQGQGILQINGLHWPVLVTPGHLQIGCEKHPHDDWRSFDNRRIAEMDGKEALKFWHENKDWLLDRCDWAAGFRKE